MRHCVGFTAHMYAEQLLFSSHSTFGTRTYTTLFIKGLKYAVPEMAVVALMIGGGVVMTSAWEEEVKNIPFSECSPAEVLWPSVGRGFSHFPRRQKNIY